MIEYDSRIFDQSFEMCIFMYDRYIFIFNHIQVTYFTMVSTIRYL